MNPNPIYRTDDYKMNPNMAKIPAAMTPPVSVDAAPVEVAPGAAEPVGVPFVAGELAGVAASPPTPVELAQSLDIIGASETNVISAHCLMDVRYVGAGETERVN